MARSRSVQVSGATPTRRSATNLALPYDAHAIYATDQLQPHAGLLVIVTETGEILQASDNIATFCQIEVMEILGRSIAQILPKVDWETLSASLKQIGGGDQRLLLHIQTTAFEVILHHQGPIALLELEPVMVDPDCVDYDRTNRDRTELFQLRQAISQLQQATDVSSCLQQAVGAMQRLAGCDRVMIYRFDAMEAGEVVAEVKPTDQPSFLGRWLPADDIPAPVREYYLQGGIRYVPDLNAPPAALIPAMNPLTKGKIDLSRVAIRGVDSCCVEYHRNMGITAFSVLPLIQAQRLWGLISLHHFQPKPLSYSVRAACEVFSQVVMSEITKQMNQAIVADVRRLEASKTQVIARIAQAEDLQVGLLLSDPVWLDLVNARGAAICLGEQITLIGQTPDQIQVQELATWTRQVLIDRGESLLSTSSLVQEYPAGAAFSAVASGIVALQISPIQHYLLLWFRPEQRQTITWLGNPDNFPEQADLNIRGPRQSFADWEQTVEATAAPWQAIELDNVLALQNALTGFVLKKAEELAQLNLELKRSNQELEAFAYAASHDLKEPLRGIYNSVMFLIEDYAQSMDGEVLDRLQNLMRLIHRMEALIDVLLKFSRLGQAELDMQLTDLDELLHQEFRIVQDSQPDRQPSLRLQRTLPRLVCDPVMTREIFRNLLSNAFKYNDKAEAWIEVGYLMPDQDEIPTVLRSPVIDYVFYIRDNGIGIRDRHLDSVFRLFKRLHPQQSYGGGTGAGLTIVKKIVERHGGDIVVESQLQQGTTFYFTLGGRR
jgi:light-regulated signal transduction histidine kinase (bacteriophytochrome)